MEALNKERQIQMTGMGPVLEQRNAKDIPADEKHDFSAAEAMEAMRNAEKILIYIQFPMPRANISQNGFGGLRLATQWFEYMKTLFTLNAHILIYIIYIKLSVLYLYLEGPG